MNCFESISDKALNGVRLNEEEGLWLLQSALPIHLASLADAVRRQKTNGEEVTFVVDTNPNYTNVCDTDCTFCAFYRKPGADGSYTHSPEAMSEKVRRAVDLGATRVLLQGGHNPDLDLNYYLSLIARLTADAPRAQLHMFSPPEIAAIARFNGVTIRETLEMFYEKGLRSIPGGGAEILSDRVRQKISPKKSPAAEWLGVMETAHQIGFKTTATMMYGHVETNEEIVRHLISLREVQDRTGGFIAFIPWSFKKGETPLSKLVKENPPPSRYFRIIALARLMLDNFDHIQASWFSEGAKAGQIALHFGADDFGGTLIEENVLKAAQFDNRTTADEVKQIIREAGFTPVERNTFYERAAIQ